MDFLRARLHRYLRFALRVCGGEEGSEGVFSSLSDPEPRWTHIWTKNYKRKHLRVNHQSSRWARHDCLMYLCPAPGGGSGGADNSEGSGSYREGSQSRVAC